MLRSVFNSGNMHNQLRYYHQSRHLKLCTKKKATRRLVGNVRVQGSQCIKEMCKTDNRQQTFTSCWVTNLFFLNKIGWSVPLISPIACCSSGRIQPKGYTSCKIKLFQSHDVTRACLSPRLSTDHSFDWHSFKYTNRRIKVTVT